LALSARFTAKLSLLNPKSISANRVASSTVIASLAPPLRVDNMEGIAVTSDGDSKKPEAYTDPGL